MSEREERNDNTTEEKAQLQPCFTEDMRKLDVERSMESFVKGNVVYIPLKTIFSFPKVNQLCGTLEKLCKLIAGKVKLSSDGYALMLSTEPEDEEN